MTEEGLKLSWEREIIKSEINVYLETFCNLLYSIIIIFEDYHSTRPDVFVTAQSKKNMKRAPL